MGARTLLLAALLWIPACIPGRVKELNRMGMQAVAAHRYDQAINHFSESLAIYPDQPKIALQLESSKTMLKQVYVFKVYELVDGPLQPVHTWLDVWKISSELPKLNVTPARVTSIRVDLNKAFTRREKQLRQKTEPHSYFLHLSHMDRLVPSAPVGQARGEVADVLQRQHVDARNKADQAQLSGLALLHTAAAATFAPGDTGLWVDVKRRQDALRQRLGIRVALDAQSTVSAHESIYLLGGIKRRLPRIFLVENGAPLKLQLRANRPQAGQNQVGDRRSAQCQVGTRRERNPECDSLKRRAEMARRTHEQKLAALQTAQTRCQSAQQPSGCTGYLSSASSDVRSAQRHYEDLEQQVSRCPEYIEKPVFKTFFYQRFTVTRSASATGTVTVSRGGQVLRSRAVQGSASASDTHGEGLSCARIPPDPLQLPSTGALLGQAKERMLDRSLGELLQMRRELARKQLAGGESRDARLDALVRARLVDESYAQVAGQLKAHLTRMWAADWDLTKRIVE
jgi:hypothetical protein